MSKRHTLGVSKWLPSTKDKITFKKGGGELDQFLQNCFDDGDDDDNDDNDYVNDGDNSDLAAKTK